MTPEQRLPDEAMWMLDRFDATASLTLTQPLLDGIQRSAESKTAETKPFWGERASWLGAFPSMGAPTEKKVDSPTQTPTLSRLEATPAKLMTAIGRGDYTLEDFIAKGGQGEVWTARQGSLGRLVAVKIATTSADDEFLAEAMTAAALEHPNIVPVYDLVPIEREGVDRRALAMKLIQGSSWHALISRDREAGGVVNETPQTEYISKHIAILISVCHAIEFAHARNILHRDLKPSQVVVGDYGEVYLLDWGMAFRMPNAAPSFVRQDNGVGTPAYMAPEQTELSLRRLGVHTDVYLLGAILYHILVGHGPHLSQTARASWFLAAANEIHPIPPNIPHDLVVLVRSALNTDPSQRPASVAAFRAQLQDYQTGASRRRDAQEFFESAQAQWTRVTSAPSHEKHMEVERKLLQARELWPMTTGLGEMLANVRRAHARFAIERGDLSLGRVLVGRVEDPAARTTLTQKLELAERSQQILTRTRNLALIAVLALTIMIVVGGGTLGMRLKAERDAAQANLMVARAQGEAGHRMLLTMIDDLQGQLDEALAEADGVKYGVAEAIKRSVYGGIADKIVKTFEAVPMDSWPSVLKFEQADRLHEVASRFALWTRPKESARLMEMVYRARRDVLGGDDLMSVDAMLEMAEQYTSAAEYEKVGTSYDSVISRYREAGLKDDPRLFRALIAKVNFLGDVAQRDRRPELIEEAQPLAEEAYQSYRAIQQAVQAGAAIDTTWVDANNLGLTLFNVGRLAEAREILEEEAASVRTNSPDDARMVSRSLGNLSRVQHTMGDLEVALENCREAVRLTEISLGPDHPMLAGQLHNLATLLISMGLLEEALTVEKRALWIWDESWGPEYMMTMDAMNLVGRVHLMLEDWPAARQVFLMDLERRMKYAPKLPDTENARENYVQIAALTVWRMHNAGTVEGLVEIAKSGAEWTWLDKDIDQGGGTILCAALVQYFAGNKEVSRKVMEQLPADPAEYMSENTISKLGEVHIWLRQELEMDAKPEATTEDAATTESAATEEGGS